MAISMYTISVPIFVQFLTALSGVLDKAVAHAEAKQLDQNFLLGMRLFPDMYPLSRQVQQATAHAMRACSALTGAAPLDMPNTETSIPELKARIAKTIDYRKKLQAGTDRRHRRQGDHAQARRQRAQVHRAGLAAQLHPAELLFPLHDSLRHPASLRAGSHQARFHGNAGEPVTTEHRRRKESRV